MASQTNIIKLYDAKHSQFLILTPQNIVTWWQSDVKGWRQH